MVNISIPHGTNSGHRNHTRKLKDCVCFSCLMAHRRHWRDYREDSVETNNHINLRRQEWRKRRKAGLPNPSLRKPLDKLTRRRANIYINGTEPYTKEQVIERWGTDCHVCLQPINWNAPASPAKGPGWEAGGQIDHVVPISRGGEDKLDNLKPIHALCNLRKGTKLMEELNLSEFLV